jgi:predicted O-linked N-acetylglucosamine transferase (SPINDLY family)
MLADANLAPGASSSARSFKPTEGPMTGTSSKMAQNRSSRRTSIREALLEEKQAQSARVTSPAVARPEEARPVGLDQDVSTAVVMSVVSYCVSCDFRSVRYAVTPTSVPLITREVFVSATAAVFTSLVATFPAWLHDSLPNTVTTTVSGAEAAHSATLHSVPTRRARVGFISKFLGVFEPHGMLLDGVMQYLPRDRFEVIALPIAEAGGKPLSPTVQTACDSVHPVALNYEHALATLQALRLDVLVFADTVSEPMNHFLARARLAPIHVRCVLYCVYCVLERPSLFCLSTFNVVHLCPEFTVAFDTLLRVFTTTIVLVQLCAEATIAFSVRICASFCHGPLIVLCVTFLLLCALQMAFWGNPITSGSHQIDYFISADVMEHPYRTRMPVTQEPYSEQVRVCVM